MPTLIQRWSIFVRKNSSSQPWLKSAIQYKENLTACVSSNPSILQDPYYQQIMKG